jgi:hypothetical protein
MFERFKRHGGDNGRGAVAVEEREREAQAASLREREARAASESRAADERLRDERLARDADPGRERTAVAPPPADTVRERDRTAVAPPPAAPVRERDRLVGPHLDRDDVRAMRARQRDRFGGFSWGSDFFGWLTAVGLASILTALLVAAGAAIGLSEVEDAAAQETVETVSVTGGIMLLAVLAIAWFAGGYVAGRMARFDGARQGIGVWLWTIIAVLAVALLAAIGGREYDLLEQLNLPRIPVGEETLTTGGAIALVAALATTLICAMLGGKLGERFHRRVDREAITERT